MTRQTSATSLTRSAHEFEQTYALVETLLGLAKALKEVKRLALDATDELPAGAAVHQLDELPTKRGYSG